ncbi:MAG: hypothetical protein ABWK53_10415 [Anaerolineales bacterium]
MSGKLHPERVIEPLVRKALETGKDRASLFSEYIKLHFRATGNLAPGCDAKDFYFVLDQILEKQKNG